MPNLNLVVENDCQQAIKNYLEQNASELLAKKINNGVKIEKDGKPFINKKTLAQFWAYASKKATEMKTGYVANETVFGWSIHYFEESDIIGTLYNEDGTEYKPPKPEYKPPVTPTLTPKPAKPKPQQASLFDLLTNPETPPKDEPMEEKTEEPVEELDDNNDGKFETPVPEEIDDGDDEPTELEVDKETGEILSIIPFKINKPNSIYERYLAVEKQYPHAVVAYRLGDFYEVFGDKAVLIAKELELILTGRDCGLAERVPMIGFPYHASDNYFRKIRVRHQLVIMEDGEIQVFDRETPKPISVPPPVVKEPESEPVPEDNDEDDLEELRTQTNHIDKDALCVLLELFNYELDVQ